MEMQQQILESLDNLDALDAITDQLAKIGVYDISVLLTGAGKYLRLRGSRPGSTYPITTEVHGTLRGAVVEYLEKRYNRPQPEKMEPASA